MEHRFGKDSSTTIVFPSQHIQHNQSQRAAVLFFMEVSFEASNSTATIKQHIQVI